MSFWGELKRRNVYKVGVAYAIVAWLLIQAASIIFPHLNLPSWAVTLVIVILIIGLPIALLLAWAYEVTPEGIKRTKHVPLAESIRHLTGQKIMYVVVALLVMAVAFLAVKVYLGEQSAIEPEVFTKVPEHAPVVVDVEETPKTLAVLPFVNRSSEKDQEYFVDGLSDEIITKLSQISDLQVTSSTSSFTFKGSDKTIQEISKILGVEYILEGSVRKVGNALRITAQLIRATDDRHLWSENYNRELEDIFAIQEDIATAVANELRATLGIDTSLKQLGSTDNAEAYEHYLYALGMQHGFIGDSDSMSDALESIDAAIALDPEFALAWATKANLHIISSYLVPANLIDSELDAALSATVTAIELEQNLAGAYSSLGATRLERGEFIEAELAYRKSRELTTEIISGDAYHNLLLAVGHFERALESIKEQQRISPLNATMSMLCIQGLCFLGDMQSAVEEYERGRALYGDQYVNWQEMKIQFGAENSMPADEILSFSFQIDNEARERIKSPVEALEELRRLYIDEDNLSIWELTSIAKWAAYFGATDFSMDVIERMPKASSFILTAIWLPIMKEVRQLPRFKEFVRKIGLVEYWNKFGWPDICHQLDNGDFECD